MNRGLVGAWLAVMGLMCGGTQAGVRLASPFTDNLVLQQGIPVAVWGTASPGERVTVRFGKQERATTADPQGNWRVTLKKLTAKSGQVPESLAVQGHDATGGVTIATVTNVLVGEVWICSGQSNMEFGVGGARNASVEKADALYPQIRMFTVAKRTAAVPTTTCDGKWIVCTPQSVGSFSAVGYFFARKLHQDLGVPVGMLHTSWGGSPVEPWTSLDALRATTAAAARVAGYEQSMADYRAGQAQFDQARNAALQKQDEALTLWNAGHATNDIGQVQRWCTGASGTNAWHATAMPMEQGAAFLGNYSGYVWCRASFEIPTAWLNRELALNLGSVDEGDTTYVNGTVVGETPDVSKWQQPRHYTIPAAAVTNQHLLLVVRVMNQIGGIGIFGTESDFNLAPKQPAPGEQPISLTKGWTYAFGSPIDTRGRPNLYVPSVPGASWDVSTLYNAMIAPLVPYGLRGAIWYQGESNSGQPQEYAELFPALIRSWRQAWGQKEFDFLFVQLANFMARQSLPVETQGWADLRESQRLTLAVPRTGMAVAIDVGEAADIHPRDKQTVGHRLACWALARTYGQKGLVHSGPLYRAMTVKDGRALVAFDHVGGGLTARGAPLTGFAVAGDDKVFHAATAVIDGSAVAVSSEQVLRPVAVRYGWANNPICNLYNAEGFAASPFRTDTWQSGEIKAAAETLVEPVIEPPRN